MKFFVFLFVCVPISANFDLQGNGRQTFFANEDDLIPSRVHVASFGLIARIQVLGKVLAQPLIVENEKTQDALLVVSTLQNYVYAFNAQTYLLKWKIWLGLPCWQLNCVSAFEDPVGIVSTPVINETTQIIYVVSRICQNDNNATSGNNETGQYYIYSISLTTGQKLNSQLLSGTHRNYTFNHTLGLQRVSLSLFHDILYFATGSFCDIGDYQGWIFACSYWIA